MNVPSNLKYTKDHEWIKVEGDTATIGITDFAQSQLGDIVFIDIDTVGETVNAEEVFGTIEAVKTVSDLFMPVTAEIFEVNPNLAEHGDLVNKDPYGQGWMIKAKIMKPEELNTLLSAEQYQAIISK